MNCRKLLTGAAPCLLPQPGAVLTIRGGTTWNGCLVRTFMNICAESLSMHLFSLKKQKL